MTGIAAGRSPGEMFDAHLSGAMTGSPPSPLAPPTPLAPPPPNRADQFAELLIGEVRQVNQMQSTADGNVHTLLTGGDVSEAEVLTSVQKADLAFRMLLQVRNKLMEAYREIQQIQI